MHVTVEDLLPLVAKLTREERVRLSQLARQVTGSEEREAAAEAYRGHVLSSGVRARGPRGIDRLDSGCRKKSGLIGV